MKPVSPDCLIDSGAKNPSARPPHFTFHLAPSTFFPESRVTGHPSSVALKSLASLNLNVYLAITNTFFFNTAEGGRVTNRAPRLHHKLLHTFYNTDIYRIHCPAKVYSNNWQRSFIVHRKTVRLLSREAFTFCRSRVHRNGEKVIMRKERLP